MPGVPLYIPTQICDTVGLDSATHPVDVCMQRVIADVGRDGVSAPAADVPGLMHVVADARGQGVDLKIVALRQNPGIDTPLRDVATDVGHAYPDSTVLVISPSFAGTYSKSVDRVTLEAGQDLAKTAGDPVVASTQFVGELTAPHFPWTSFTIVVVLAVALATVATRLLRVRAKRATAAETAAAAPN